MNKSIQLNSQEQELLLTLFNSRNAVAFGRVYSMFYKDFNYYATYLYCQTNINSEDVIHDVFIRIWEDKNIQFKTVIMIKAFVFISIKNSYKNFVNHKKIELKYRSAEIVEQQFEWDIIESELYSKVDAALNILPQECAKVFKLYLEGWKPEEIATKLDKSIQTIYNTKQRAIGILKSKMPK